MPKAHINDIDLYYEQYGSGEPLLLIMGLGANLDWWGPGFIHTLAEKYQVIAFDNRGAGRSDVPGGPYSIRQFADDAVALLDVLGISQVHVFGSSMGGMIAQELTVLYPERVKKLILGCTTCGGEQMVQPSAEVLNVMMQQGSPEEQKMATVRLLFPPEFIKNNRGFIDKNWEKISQHFMEPNAYMNQLMAIDAWQGVYTELASIEKPTLVLHGTEDILIPVANGELIASQVPGATLILFDGCGHGFQGQRPREVLQTVLDFLAD